ncbi:MAG: hypothetical protein ACRCXZ_10300 [Patescibacteria group bacterium]
MTKPSYEEMTQMYEIALELSTIYYRLVRLSPKLVSIAKELKKKNLTYKQKNVVNTVEEIIDRVSNIKFSTVNREKISGIFSEIKRTRDLLNSDKVDINNKIQLILSKIRNSVLSYISMGNEKAKSLSDYKSLFGESNKDFVDTMESYFKELDSCSTLNDKLLELFEVYD